MPTTKEFTVQLEDRPGTIGKLCRALADRGANILAFQAFPAQGKSEVRLVIDNPAIAKSVLESQGLGFTESDAVQAKLPNRPGELGRAASRLGEASININYAYSGADPGTNLAFVIFGVGVADVARAVAILDQAAAAART